MKIRIVIVIFVIMLVYCSCCGKWSGWDKDYYDYQVGAYINGQECHESRHQFLAPARKSGVLRIRRNGFFFFYYLMEHFCLEENSFSEYVFYPEIVIIVDTADYHPGITYSFNNQDRVDDGMWRNRFYGSNEYDLDSNVPIIWGRVVKLQRDQVYYKGVVYFIKEGSITLGEFDEQGCNIDPIHFQFAAESLNGKTITASDGYINRYNGEW